jgi:DNA-binding MarR family transcriptional regulator
MAYKIFNDETGEIHEPKRKKIKRTEPFFMVELKSAEELAGIKELHGTEHRVLWFILSRMNFEGKAFPKQAAIAESLGMPKSQVSVAIKRLVECGAISKIREDRNDGFQVHQSLASRGSLTK